MIFPEKYTLAEVCLKAQSKYKKKTCFQTYRDGGICNRYSYLEFGRRVISFASMLRRLGIKRGDRVMIAAENRPEWPVAYFGTALAGGISVPVQTSFNHEQILSIAKHTEISALCHTALTASKISGIDSSIPKIQIDAEQNYGTSLDAKDFEEAGEDDPASIIYTPGSTGSSKGVVLSHRNLVFIAASSGSLMKIYPRDRFLSVISLAHIYECSLGMLAPVMSGASVTYLDKPPSPGFLLPAMRSLRPTAIITVPVFMEKICREKIFPALKKNGFYKFSITRRLTVRVAGAKLLSAMGSSIRLFGIGGAPLSEDVESFLREAGFPYASGYGLTETAPLVSGAAPYEFPVNSSGKALKGTELRISDEGEIQVRGPHVMLGYYRDKKKTSGAFTGDGWFKTGDLGRLDDKNNLYIHGRMKAPNLQTGQN